MSEKTKIVHDPRISSSREDLVEVLNWFEGIKAQEDDTELKMIASKMSTMALGAALRYSAEQVVALTEEEADGLSAQDWRKVFINNCSNYDRALILTVEALERLIRIELFMEEDDYVKAIDFEPIERVVS